MIKLSIASWLLIFGLAVGHAAENATSAKPGSTPYTYKTVDGTELKLWVRSPDGAKPTDRRPAVVFFHGGGWVGGEVLQFETFAISLAKRGMVTVQVEYRLVPKGENVPPLVCVQDAKSAMRWVRSHAAELGLDPLRIASGGGSAGGHLAACVGMVDGLDDPHDDLAISAKSAAMLLYNPVFNNGPGGYGHERIGKRWREFSPAHHISAGAPPAIVFLGTKDSLIPVKTVEDFKVGMTKVGVRCETYLYEGRAHGFFNKEPDLSATIKLTDAFLVSLGWLVPAP